MTITATVGTFSTDLDYTLTVTNVNDNAPVFTAGQDSDSVAENTATGTTLRTFAATADAGTVSYTIGGSDAALFSIDESTGALTLASSLDFETASSHNITVTATVGTLSSTLDYTLAVTNVNDNAPVFAAGQGSDSVAENSVTGIILRTFVVTTDAGTVTYGISGADVAFFAIDQTRGELTLASSLDFETATSHNITVTATVGALSTDLDYTLTVTNVFDTPPTFVDGQTEDTVAEDIPVGTVIRTFALATDEGPVTFLESGTGAQNFNVDQNTGALSIRLPLDFETTQSYTLTIIAVSTANTRLLSSIDWTLTVTDVNDVSHPSSQEISKPIRYQKIPHQVPQ